MSSFLTSQSQLRRGKWTAEEEVYASCIMEAFKEGSLKDVEDGMSLRGYLAKKLRTNVKRISKKVSAQSSVCNVVMSRRYVQFF